MRRSDSEPRAPVNTEQQSVDAAIMIENLALLKQLGSGGLSVGGGFPARAGRGAWSRTPCTPHLCTLGLLYRTVTEDSADTLIVSAARLSRMDMLPIPPQ